MNQCTTAANYKIPDNNSVSSTKNAGSGKLNIKNGVGRLEKLKIKGDQSHVRNLSGSTISNGEGASKRKLKEQQNFTVGIIQNSQNQIFNASPLNLKN